MQKTDFPFEVIIHDDASTDGTAAIIREYEAAHPDIIKPIYQTENQYSKPNTPIMKTFLYPKAKGRFFVCCDGDDYLTDPRKLQRQAEYLLANPDCSLIAHRARWQVERDESLSYDYPAEENERDYGREELFVHGGGLFSTNSYMLRREVAEEMPDELFLSGMWDYPVLIHAAILGRVHYVPDVMSCHNDRTAGSWSRQVWDDLGERIGVEEAVIAMMERLDAYYDGRYHTEAAAAIRFRQQYLTEWQYEKLMLEGRTREASRGSCRPYYLRDKRQKRRNAIKKAFPFLKTIKDAVTGRHE